MRASAATTTGLASARLTWPALHRLRALGVDPTPPLEAIGVDAARLSDADHRMPEEELDAIWVACRDASDDEAFGVLAGLDSQPGELGVVEYVMRNSASLGDAIERGMRYQRILHDSGADRVDVEGGVARLSVGLSSGRSVAGVLVDFGFARAIAAAMLLTGVARRPLEVRFEHPAPRRLGPWERTFHCPLVFGAEANVMSIERERLEAPIPAGDPGLLGILEQHARARLDSIGEAPAGVIGRVRACIVDELTGGTPTVERVAGQLKMSSRTLSRRLAEEGASFSALLDALREEIAVSHLREGDLSVSEVAFLLGFRDSNAFSRAFKRWTGAPPSHYRRTAR